MTKDDNRIAELLREEIRVQTAELERIPDPEKRAQHAELIAISQRRLDDLTK